MTRHDVDAVVVGSGIAGLFFALKLAEARPETRIAIITKKGESESSTNWAQGGIAAVLAPTDSVEAHVADTLEVGRGLCHREVVEDVVATGRAVIDDLIGYGVRFTQKDGGLSLGREGGHSHNRVVHADDLTGKEIERALLDQIRARSETISLRTNCIAVDLIREPDGDRCAGVLAYSETERVALQYVAPITMLATGGCGQVYYHTSNPKIATGDGVAIAHRAGVPIANMEFIQFHPTTLYAPGRWPFLISEAVRGEGAFLRTVDGSRFMVEAHPDAELAPRDVVARAIDRELKMSGEDYVLLDISHRDPEFIRTRFPNIYDRCLHYGFDITKRDIPVVPAAHYTCGGVMSTLDGQTALSGLLVAGEVAMTGMHGANRLASNSLLEAVVMARRSATFAVERLNRIDARPQVPDIDVSVSAGPVEKGILAHWKKGLRMAMSDLVGIVRTRGRLERAARRIAGFRSDIETEFVARPLHYYLIELRNLAQVAELIIQSAQRRPESRGLHWLDDCPESNDDYKHDTVIVPSAHTTKVTT